MQVVLRESGGLGNQLFQYAALRYYSGRYDAQMRIAIDPAWNAVSFGYPRPCLLQHFCIPALMRERSFVDRISFTDKYWLKAITAPFRKALGIQVFIEQPEQRYSFLRDLPLDPAVTTLYLGGYWQSWALVEEVAADLRRDLAFSESAQGKNLEILDQINRTSNAVSLHIRRGDATLPVEGKVILSKDYYLNAISSMQERLVDPTFFVFSDDIAFAKKNLPLAGRVIFVQHNDDFAAHEDLRLMSSCRNHILANSTFSWWGAWLNPQPDKIVIAPRNWFLAETCGDLLDPNWVLAEVARGG